MEQKEDRRKNREGKTTTGNKQQRRKSNKDNKEINGKKQ
jgi:hypothetical protein